MSNVTKEFVLAGKSIFTVELPEDFRKEYDLKPHYTFRITRKAASGQYKEAWFVSLLTGAENTTDYSYIGMLNAEKGQAFSTAKSKLDYKHIVFKLLNRVLALIWAGDTTPMTDKGFGLHHEGRCGKCGRLLTTPTSIALGIGPECWSKMNGGHYPHLKLKGQFPDQGDGQSLREIQMDAQDDENPDRSSRAEDRDEARAEEKLPYWHDDYEEDPADMAERQAVMNAYRRLAEGN